MERAPSVYLPVEAALVHDSGDMYDSQCLLGDLRAQLAPRYHVDGWEAVFAPERHLPGSHHESWRLQSEAL